MAASSSRQSIKFNKRIYRTEAVRKAVRDYSHIASFEVRNNKDYLVVTVEKADPELKGVFCDEFANYVLGMSKKWI